MTENYDSPLLPPEGAATSVAPLAGVAALRSLSRISSSQINPVTASFCLVVS